MRTNAVSYAVCALLVVAPALSACDSSNQEMPGPSGENVGASASVDAAGDLLENPDLVRYVLPEQWGSAQVECLKQEGFPGGLVMPDGGLFYPEIPAAQASVYEAAQSLCARRYPVEPRFRTALNEAQLTVLHYYYEDSLVPCIEEQGLDVGGLPTLQRFIETYFTDGWTPFATIESLDEEGWLELRDVCPEWPEGFFE